MGKIPVSVIAVFTSKNSVYFNNRVIFERTLPFSDKAVPLKILTREGRTLRIDRIMDIRRAAAFKAGEVGLKYTCSIDCGDVNREVYLWRKEDEWFMEDE